MNRHFQDTRYYLKRTVETAAKGLKTELEPAERRLRAVVGSEKEPEPNRIETVKGELKGLQRKAGDEAEIVVEDARGKIERLRRSEA